MGCAKGALSKNQECLPDVIEKAVEVQNKTYWTIVSISAIVSEEAKDGLVGTDESERHIAATREGGALFCSYMNFSSLQQIEMSWPLARQNSQRVPFEDWEEGRPEIKHGGAVITAIEGCEGRESVANTWLEDDMW